jgi:hypothetical protein
VSEILSCTPGEKFASVAPGVTHATDTGQDLSGTFDLCS